MTLDNHTHWGSILSYKSHVRFFCTKITIAVCKLLQRNRKPHTNGTVQKVLCIKKLVLIIVTPVNPTSNILLLLLYRLFKC